MLDDGTEGRLGRAAGRNDADKDARDDGDGRDAEVVVEGRLDESSAFELLGAVHAAVAHGKNHLEVDLRRVTSYTDDGVAAITECLALRRELDRGVALHVATEAGRQVLLASMART